MVLRHVRESTTSPCFCERPTKSPASKIFQILSQPLSKKCLATETIPCGANV